MFVRSDQLSVILGAGAGLIVVFAITYTVHVCLVMRQAPQSDPDARSGGFSIMLSFLVLGGIFGFVIGSLVGFVIGILVGVFYGPLTGSMGGGVGGIIGSVAGTLYHSVRQKRRS